MTESFRRHSRSESRPQPHHTPSWTLPSPSDPSDPSASSSPPFHPPTEVHEWHRDGFLVTTDRTLVSLPALATAFASPAMYWTTAYPDPVMRALIDNSCCFSLLNTEGQIGFARAVTDYVTFFYLTDVYVDAKWQRQGLGTWMIGCVQEFVEAMPYLRGSMLLTSKGSSEEFYRKNMRMGPLPERVKAMMWKGPGSQL